jgi:hypothetical protein
MTDAERIERLERDNARLRAENDELRKSLRARGLSFVPWWKSLWRWLANLPRTSQRKRFAAHMAERDAREEAEHQEELRRHLVGADDV